MKISKRMKKVMESYDPAKLYGLTEAVNLIKKNANCKFDEGIDIAMNVNVDPKKSDQTLRGMVVMPNGTGKTVRIAVFAKAEKADEARAAGADIVGDADLVERIQSGNIDFDVCIATPDMMGSVGKVGKLLGPKGLMPNPKLGTVTPDLKSAIERARKGVVEYRAEKAGVVHANLCKASFSAEKIVENVKCFIDEITRARPASVKGTYVKSVFLSSTMGGSVRLDLSQS